MVNSKWSQFAKHDPKPIGLSKTYGILIPLIKKEDIWHLVFETRAFHMRAQPGEICFPGGMVERGESPQGAAVREACEELGIDASQIELLGPTDYMLTPFGSLLYPFAAILHVESVDDLTPNPAEVDHIFTVPIDELAVQKPEKHVLKTQYLLQADFPYHKIQNGTEYRWKTGEHAVYFYTYQDKIIWGLTANILKTFLEQLQKIQSGHFT